MDEVAPLGQDDMPVRSVARAIDVLLALVDGPQSLGAVAERTNLSKGTCHRLLASLAYRQLVLQDSTTSAYILGPGCFRFVEAMASGLGGIGAIARPTLDELWWQTGETVTLHIRIGAQRICIEELASKQVVRYVAGVGSTAPAYVGAAGKILLAFLDEEERERRIASLHLDAITEQTLVDRQALEDELGRIRQVGWASSRGERVVGAAAVSGPVFDREGRVVAALSVLGPEARVATEEQMAKLPLLVTAAARTVSTNLSLLE